VQEKFPTPHAGKISRNSVEPALPDTAHARIRITQDGLNHFAGAMTRVSLCDAPESLQRAAQGVASMGEFKAWGLNELPGVGAGQTIFTARCKFGKV